MKKNISLIILLSSIFTLSCGKKDLINKGVIGQFAITNLTFENKDLLTNLNLNFIEFYKNGELKIPKIVDRYNEGLTEDVNVKGSWELIQNGEKIQILIGQYGAYIKQGRKNFKIPKGKEAKDLTLEECLDIIANDSKSKGRTSTVSVKKAPAKKTTTAKKTTAKKTTAKKPTSKKSADK